MKGAKTGGRKKGSKNRIPKDLRESITDFLFNNFENVTIEWEKLDNPKDKLNFYKDLLNYAIPKLQSTEYKVDLERMSEDELDIVVEKLLTKSNKL